MAPTLQEAKSRLDSIIKKSKSDLYKPIQIAEVLYHSRIDSQIDPSRLEDFQNPSLHWRDEITMKFTGKRSTSSARYQHDVWSRTAMPPDYLVILDNENKRLNGNIEKYIYRRYFLKQRTIGTILSYVDSTSAEDFDLSVLLKLFTSSKGLRRSIDKAYEIVSYCLFETIVVALAATIKLEVPSTKIELLAEFPDLAKMLLGIDAKNMSFELPAHIYRAGVTNSADSGLDMWANFGIAIQVKHLTLNEKLAKQIIDQIESDYIVIVCKDSEARTIQTIAKQISWGKRVRGIIKESDLIRWYEKCLRGNYSSELGNRLVTQLASSFHKEFPQNESLLQKSFFEERGYSYLQDDHFWQVER